MNLGIAAGYSCTYRSRDHGGVQSNPRPLRSAQNHYRYSAPRKILLKSNVLVGSKKDIEPGLLRFG
jgi:hypothetical protein